MKIQFHNRSYTARALAEMSAGSLHTEELGDIAVRGLCTDSREADAETAFVAMRGERVNGHDYMESALANGCRCFICERNIQPVADANAAAVVVGDSEMALSRLADAYRRTLTHKTVAVTGSVGKTTAKEMIAAVLSRAKKTYKSEGNHNSVVGMPLSMLETPADTEVSVLEMGMSAFGEIERMSITAQPDVAVITNIGSSHMEMLGSRENICRAKLEILCGLADGGTLILNGDEPLLANVSGKSYQTLYVSLSRQNADFFAQNIRIDLDSTRFDVVWKGGVCRDLELRVPGRHNVYAALYAFATGILMGLDTEQIREGLLDFEAAGMRQNRYSVKDITVIEDCYNASPESMIAALDVLRLYSLQAGGRSIAVLGDMLELGEGSSAAHRKVGAHLADCGIDDLIAVGLEGVQISTGAMQRGMSPSRMVRENDRDAIERIGNALLERLRPGDTVLFKASRSVRLERVIAYLKEHY